MAVFLTCPRCGAEAKVNSFGGHTRISVTNFEVVCAELPPLPPGQPRQIRGEFDRCATLSASIERAQH
jgi:hypothetical protein